jgi:hypothetical protein
VTIDFATRLGQHETHRQRVTAFFRGCGCRVHEYGVERMSSSFHQALLRCGMDPTAQFLRFQPDEALVVLGQRRAYLCEVKSTLPDTRTGNVAYELASWNTALALTQIQVAVFVVFGNYTAAWPQAIQFSRCFTDPDYLRRISRGSRTPFGIFPADAPWLRPLPQFAEEEMGCSLIEF